MVNDVVLLCLFCFAIFVDFWLNNAVCLNLVILVFQKVYQLNVKKKSIVLDFFSICDIIILITFNVI